MIQKIRPYRATLLAVLLGGVSTISLLAQGAGGPPPGGPGAHHHGPPPNALFDALDTNHDGIISADEMAHAADSLKALLKPGANQLTREDLRPMRPVHTPEGDDAPAADNERPHPRLEGIRPHNPPPMNDQATPEDAAERHAPPAPDMAERHERHERPAPEMAERHTPPAPEEDAQRGPQADERERHAHHGPPPSPLFDALDTNHDGVISEEEMSKAADALKGLLRPGSSELRREDLRPMQPPHPRED